MSVPAHKSQAALEQLVRSLRDTSLREPRPVVDLGLTAEQRAAAAERFRLRAELLRSAAVLIPIQCISAERGHYRIVLTQRAEHLRNHAGQISFPGGMYEPQDQDLAQTALRESEEEIGLAPQHVQVIGFLPDYPTITGFSVTPVVGLVQAEAVFVADQSEVAGIHFLPFTTLLEDHSIRRSTITHKGLELPFTEIHHGDLRVWGATAAMLDMLRHIATGQPLSVLKQF